MADTESAPGCARPTSSVAAEPAEIRGSGAPPEETRTRPMGNVMVGRKAPDFETPAWRDGKFTSVKLSDYLGKWVVLCFYPGDYTFV